MLFEPLALRFLCDVVGADKVMLGSDYPFGIGDPDPCGVVDHTRAHHRRARSDPRRQRGAASFMSTALAARRLVPASRRRSRRDSASAAATARSGGKVTVASVPAPTTLFSSSRPPCTSMIALTVGSPSPVPR